jgi:hypothetical protein
MRLRNPRKLGFSLVSWLRHDGLDCEWMASTWRYLPLRIDLLSSSGALAEPLAAAGASSTVSVGGGVEAEAVAVPVAFPSGNL